MSEALWLIWSNEHRAWWRPGAVAMLGLAEKRTLEAAALVTLRVENLSLRAENQRLENFIADAITLLRSHQNKPLVEGFLDELFAHKTAWKICAGKGEGIEYESELD